MTLPSSSPQPPASAARGEPQAEALARVGAQVRARLEADAAAYRLPTDEIEIFAVARFLAPDEAARLVATIDRVAQPSTLFDPDPAFRTSSSGDFDTADPLVRAIEQRIDTLVGLPREWGETIQGQRYRPGEQFKDHRDYFPTDDRHWDKVRRLGGQRSWTAMAYLNAVEEGGATFFSAIGLTVLPQPGLLLAWNNMRADGTPNPYTQHAGLPVTRGVKYVITRWYRARRWLAEAWVE